MNVLVAGETWTTYGVHIKGMSAYTTASYEVSLSALEEALAGKGVDITHIPNHDVPRKFPRTVAELKSYDVVVLSDVPADTLLLHPDTYLHSKRTPNLFATLREWVEGGGGMAMIGGYMSFAGFEGKARYYMTSLQDWLPVSILTHDDRVEIPEGINPVVVDPRHAIVKGIPQDWPHFLGYNRIVPKADSNVILKIAEDPLLAVRELGSGRVAAFASDISPHWAPPEFLEWAHYGRFWRQLFGWLAHE
jgi:uncharacterized membrane protein